MSLKMFGLAALAAALMALFAAGTASATIIESGSGTQYKAGTSFTAEAEGTTELHPPIGSVNCKKSTLGGKTTNDGGAELDVTGNTEVLTFSECNATVTVISKGPIKWLKKVLSKIKFSVSFSITISYSGFHCVFTPNNTEVGTFTSSSQTGSNGTLDLEATIPRTGGSSGAFCGTTAQWTGSYKFTNPSTLNAT